MGFFDALKRVLGGSHDHPHPPEALAKAWGLDEEGEAAGDGAGAGDPEPSEYDRAQWVRRFKRVLDELPGSAGEWDDLAADARALGLQPAWLKQQQRDEFRMMVRRAVADRKFTDAEHRKIDQARDLMGLPEAEAEAILHEVVAEAEKFFGKAVEGA